MKLSNRLQIIANLIEEEDKVVDIGCDHAYLSIYLALNKLCLNIIATEINEGPYNIALNNIKKYNVLDKIKLYCTDGLTNVFDEINTIVIAGMGASTIINILSAYNLLNKIDKIVIQSNNDWEMVRRFLNSKNFYIENEYHTYENKKDYITILAKQTNKQNTEDELIIGLNRPNLKKFYIKQYNKYEEIIKNIRNKNDVNYKKISKKLKKIKKYIN